MPMFPVFLKLGGRRGLLVGGGRVAAGKLRALLKAGAHVRVIALEIAAAPAEPGAAPAARRLPARTRQSTRCRGGCTVPAMRG
ncbi:MAG: hypothetical protein H0T05_01035 [Acidobacteria bacterium]|nr:hypothetical protein [Acidobacteriota bacterium]MBA3888802.1 hypothetical protein [Acidobacteriota bacterium]